MHYENETIPIIFSEDSKTYHKVEKQISYQLTAKFCMQVIIMFSPIASIPVLVVSEGESILKHTIL